MTAANADTTAATRSTAMCSSTVSAIACRLPPYPRANVTVISTAETTQLTHHAFTTQELLTLSGTAASVSRVW